MAEVKTLAPVCRGAETGPTVAVVAMAGTSPEAVSDTGAFNAFAGAAAVEMALSNEG